MRGHLPTLDHGVMDSAHAPYIIRINGHVGATVLSALPALARRYDGVHAVLTGLLDQSNVNRVPAEIDVFGVDLERSIAGACSLHFRRLYGQ